MSGKNVFHTVTWIEGPRTISMSLGLEGPIALRADAERVAEGLRQLAHLVTPDADHEVRIGILEIPAPTNAAIAATHLAVRTNVDDVMASIEAKIAAERAES